MLKRSINFTDYDGEEVTEVYYFNISKPELMEMEVEHKEGMAKRIQFIIDTKEHKELLRTFKELILLAYGQKSEDGKRFIKNDQLREEFSQTEAYNVLYMELATDDDAAVTFLTGILPKDMQDVEGLKTAIKDQTEKMKEESTTAVAAAPKPPTS